MLGALSHADSHPHIFIRDFRVPRSFEGSRTGGVLQQLIKWKPHGLLTVLDTKALEQLLRRMPESRPIINMAGARPMPGVHFVTGNLAPQIEVCVRHFRHQGLRSLAYFDTSTVTWNNRAIDLFKEIARPPDPARAILIEPVKDVLLEDPFAPVTPVKPRLANWLKNLPKPVGIVCRSFGSGGYLIRVCQALGWRVPEDVAIIGEDDTDLALASSPTLTTALPIAQQIGAEAMRILDEMMHGHPGPADFVRLDAIDLRVRESTGSKGAEVCDIAAAVEYINRNARQGISVEQVIKETQHVSKATFHKHFLAATGQTPGEAIQQRQLEESRQLLANTRLSITTIAGQCGFDNSSNFSRNFRALQGMTPRDYRRQARAAAPETAGLAAKGSGQLEVR